MLSVGKLLTVHGDFSAMSLIDLGTSLDATNKGNVHELSKKTLLQVSELFRAESVLSMNKR